MKQNRNIFEFIQLDILYTRVYTKYLFLEGKYFVKISSKLERLTGSYLRTR